MRGDARAADATNARKRVRPSVRLIRSNMFHFAGSKLKKHAGIGFSEVGFCADFYLWTKIRQKHFWGSTKYGDLASKKFYRLFG